MSLTVEQGKMLVIEFCRQYPAALEVDYRIRLTQEELYGKDYTTEAHGVFLAGFAPATTPLHRGRCDIAVANARDETDFKETLRHEILGHYGINTFNPGEKQLVLNAVHEARNQPGMHELWAAADRDYADKTDPEKAEEVYCFVCEGIDPAQPVDKALGEQALRAILFHNTRTKPMQLDDLSNIASMVAEGLRDRTRTQQTFPSNPRLQFRTDMSKADTVDQSAAAGHVETDHEKIANHAYRKITAYFNLLSKDPRYAAHTDRELTKVAYFRGVQEKSTELSGKPSKLDEFDALMANRDITKQLPEVRDLPTLPRQNVASIATPDDDRSL
jgi:hypothetical protein